MQDTSCFWWEFGKRHLSLNSIISLINWSISLSEACHQVKSGSNFIGLSLAKSSYLAQITSKLRFSVGKHHDTYWSIPKSPPHTMTFLHFIDSDNMVSSQSNLFSHFSFHLRNIWYKLPFTIQSIFGPSIYDINMGCTKECGWLVDGWKHCGLCTSISWSELEDSCETMEFSWETFVLTTWAEFFAGLGISGLWILVLRPLQSSTTTIKTVLTSQAISKF